jgi:hypothetical protein
MDTSKQLRMPPMEVKAVGRPVPTADNSVDTERSWLRLVSRALGKCHRNQEDARRTMDVDPGTFSAQLNCVPNRHLSFRKMVHLGPDFWREMVELICEFHGLQPPGMTADDMEALRIGKAQIELHRQIAKAVSR